MARYRAVRAAAESQAEQAPATRGTALGRGSAAIRLRTSSPGRSRSAASPRRSRSTFTRPWQGGHDSIIRRIAVRDGATRLRSPSPSPSPPLPRSRRRGAAGTGHRDRRRPGLRHGRRHQLRTRLRAGTARECLPGRSRRRRASDHEPPVGATAASPRRPRRVFTAASDGDGYVFDRCDAAATAPRPHRDVSVTVDADKASTAHFRDRRRRADRADRLAPLGLHERARSRSRATAPTRQTGRPAACRVPRRRDALAARGHSPRRTAPPSTRPRPRRRRRAGVCGATDDRRRRQRQRPRPRRITIDNTAPGARRRGRPAGGDVRARHRRRRGRSAASDADERRRRGASAASWRPAPPASFGACSGGDAARTAVANQPGRELHVRGPRARRGRAR